MRLTPVPPRVGIASVPPPVGIRVIATIRRLAMGGLVFALGSGAGALGAACTGDEDDDGTTTGQRVTLATTVEMAGPATFTNAFDWEIVLSRAIVSNGAFYYFEGAPIDSTQASLPRREVGASSLLGLLRWLAPSVAHAHPGHYQPGEARGEMLESSSFDLLAGPTTLADGDGITGMVRSGRFTWGAPPTGPMADVLGDAVVVVEGAASKGDQQKVFRLVAKRADVLDAADEPLVEGCVFEEFDVQSDGTVTLRIAPRVWLDQAELDDVPDSADGEPVDVPADDRASKAFIRGVKKSSAFVFTYSKG